MITDEGAGGIDSVVGSEEVLHYKRFERSVKGPISIPGKQIIR